MKSKVVPGIAFVLLLRFLGLFLGIILGALVVPEGSGLAGPGIVFGYGIVSGGIAVVLGSMLARTLAYAQLRTALVGTGVSALLACGWIAYRYFTVQQPARSWPQSTLGEPAVVNEAEMSGRRRE